MHDNLRSRFASLKLRALLLALGALPACYFGIHLFFSNLVQLVYSAYDLSQNQTSVPLLHIPPSAPENLFSWLPQLAFFAVGGLCIWGFSTGAFGRSSAKIVFIPVVALVMSISLFVPGANLFGKAFPGKLERQILRAQFAQAEASLADMHLSENNNQYIRAQIAMRARDAQGVKQQAEPLLQLTDKWAYGLLKDSGSDAILAGELMQFNPEVIHALDVALNQKPETQVGIQWEQQHGLQRQERPLWHGVKLVLTLVIGALLFFAALAAWGVWNRMRMRIREIDGFLLEKTVSGSADSAPDSRRSKEMPASISEAATSKSGNMAKDENTAQSAPPEPPQQQDAATTIPALEIEAAATAIMEQHAGGVSHTANTPTIFNKPGRPARAFIVLCLIAIFGLLFYMKVMRAPPSFRAEKTSSFVASQART